MPNTAYSAAKFAVKGFTEALIEDLRSQRAPGPGGRGDARARGHRHHGEHPPRPRDGSRADDRGRTEGHPGTRLAAAGLLAEGASAEELRQMLIQDEQRLPGQGAGQRGAGGDRHPRRGALRGLADPGRRGRQDDRRSGSAPTPRPPTTTPSCSAGCYAMTGPGQPRSAGLPAAGRGPGRRRLRQQQQQPRHSACPAKTGKAVTASSPVAATGKPAAGWTLPGADLANTRDVASAITSSNVAKLGVAWTRAAADRRLRTPTAPTRPRR